MIRLRVHIPNHPNAHKDGRIFEHRFIAAKALGKPLPTKAVVHHYGNELVICEDETYHKFLHTRQKAYEATGDPHKRKCCRCLIYDDIENLHQTHGRDWVQKENQIQARDWDQYYHIECLRKAKERWKKAK